MGSKTALLLETYLHPHSIQTQTNRLETSVDSSNCKAQYGLFLTLCMIVDPTLLDMYFILRDNVSLNRGTIPMFLQPFLWTCTELRPLYMDQTFCYGVDFWSFYHSVNTVWCSKCAFILITCFWYKRSNIGFLLNFSFENINRHMGHVVSKFCDTFWIYIVFVSLVAQRSTKIAWGSHTSGSYFALRGCSAVQKSSVLVTDDGKWPWWWTETGP
jgi:hypothetical protein